MDRRQKIDMRAVTSADKRVVDVRGNREDELEQVVGINLEEGRKRSLPFERRTAEMRHGVTKSFADTQWPRQNESNRYGGEGATAI